MDYINADASKKAAAGERKTVRAQLDSLRLLIKAAREEIQFAADAEWPHTATANAEVRMEFLLDPNARFKG